MGTRTSIAHMLTDSAKWLAEIIAPWLKEPPEAGGKTETTTQEMRHGTEGKGKDDGE